MKPSHAVVMMQDGVLIMKCLRCGAITVPADTEIEKLAELGKAFGKVHEQCEALQ